jgi:hypothetical protein
MSSVQLVACLFCVNQLKKTYYGPLKHHTYLLVVLLKRIPLQKRRAVVRVLHPVVVCTQLKQKLVVVQTPIPPQPRTNALGFKLLWKM